MHTLMIDGGKEAINLKKNMEGYMVGLGGRKGKDKCCN